MKRPGGKRPVLSYGGHYVTPTIETDTMRHAFLLAVQERCPHVLAALYEDVRPATEPAADDNPAGRLVNWAERFNLLARDGKPVAWIMEQARRTLAAWDRRGTPPRAPFSWEGLSGHAEWTETLELTWNPLTEKREAFDARLKAEADALEARLQARDGYKRGTHRKTEHIDCLALHICGKRPAEDGFGLTYGELAAVVAVRPRQLMNVTTELRALCGLRPPRRGGARTPAR